MMIVVSAEEQFSIGTSVQNVFTRVIAPGMPRRALVDLVFTMGFYHQISMTLNAFNVPLPQGVTPPFKEPKV